MTRSRAAPAQRDVRTRCKHTEVPQTETRRSSNQVTARSRPPPLTTAPQPGPRAESVTLPSAARGGALSAGRRSLQSRPERRSAPSGSRRGNPRGDPVRTCAGLVLRHAVVLVAELVGAHQLLLWPQEPQAQGPQRLPGAGHPWSEHAHTPTAAAARDPRPRAAPPPRRQSRDPTPSAPPSRRRACQQHRLQLAEAFLPPANPGQHRPKMAERCRVAAPSYHVGVYFGSSGRARRSLAAAPGWVHTQVEGPAGKEAEAGLRGAGPQQLLHARGLTWALGPTWARGRPLLSSARAEGRALPHRLHRERGEVGRSGRQSSSVTWCHARQGPSCTRRYSSGKGSIGFVLEVGNCPVAGG